MSEVGEPADVAIWRLIDPDIPTRDCELRDPACDRSRGTLHNPDLASAEKPKLGYSGKNALQRLAA